MLTNEVMPGMYGPEMGRRAVLSRPKMKVPYISGYPNDAVIRHRAL
jgi:hypothetical protein